jgi:hypothetical protein
LQHHPKLCWLRAVVHAHESAGDFDLDGVRDRRTLRGRSSGLQPARLRRQDHRQDKGGSRGLRQVLKPHPASKLIRIDLMTHRQRSHGNARQAGLRNQPSLEGGGENPFAVGLEALNALAFPL